MRIVDTIRVPTGHILVVEGERGKLECLSLGDYGAKKNLKADFLGYTEPITQVKHGELMPLEEKWVITVSTQYGCSCRCQFCDVPNVRFGGNASVCDLLGQIESARSLHPEVAHGRINVHFARMGEPTFNMDAVIAATRALQFPGFQVHPVVSTMIPYAFAHRIADWAELKNKELGGDAGLQLSINSTSARERDLMFGGYAIADLDEVGYRLSALPRPVGRKYTLNFALAGWEIDPQVLLRNFDPESYICKLTPMHRTSSAVAHGISTDGDPTTYEPYAETEDRLKRAGYDVIVFIASLQEDRSAITCGNAILGGSKCDAS